MTIHDGLHALSPDELLTALVEARAKVAALEAELASWRTVGGILDEHFGPMRPVTGEGRRMLKIYNDVTAEFSP